MKLRISVIFCILCAILWLLENVELSNVKTRHSALVVAVKNYEPFAYIDSSSGSFKGIDILLVNTIAEHLQTNVKLFAADNGSIKWVIRIEIFFSDQKSHFEFSRNADLFIGGMSQVISHFQTNGFWSRAYSFHDDLTWCVRPAQPLPMWMNVFQLCTVGVAIIAVILYIICVYLLYALTTFDDRPVDIWKSTIIFLQAVVLVPVAYKPKRANLQLHFISGHFMAMITNAMLVAFCMKFLLASRYEKQIQTFDQLVEHDFLIAGDDTAKNYLEENQMVTPRRRVFFCHILINL